MIRVGIGQDSHRLVEGRPLVVGGVRIESKFGAAGHSDADALVHAICDAILGAMAEGDIGKHFPDNDTQWKNADSLQLLARVMWLVNERGMRVVNVDSNVHLERPKLKRYIHLMRENLAGVLSIDTSMVSVKAKTAEGLDAVGRGEAISAQAIVLLEQG